MLFTLEAVYAFHGDALLLHYGPQDAPNRILIDGGASGTFKEFLGPRLKEIKEALGGPVPLRMVMVSHTDSDHIAGVLDLFKVLDGDDPLCEVGTLWHNSFDDVIGNEDEELVSKLLLHPAPPDHETDAVISSVNQGRNLRNDAIALAIEANRPFRSADGQKPGLILANPNPIDQGHGLTFHVIGPNPDRVREYQAKWNEFLEEKGLAEVEAAGFDDNSAFNLASIVVLAQLGDRRMLLTGDARGDFIVNGLVDAGLLEEESRYPERKEGQRKRDWVAALKEADVRPIAQPLHVDLLKVAHHGSANNVMEGFFRRVTADHYVISGNGNHDNPDPATLRMLAAARGDDEYTIHFTFTEDQHLTEPTEEFREALVRVHEWVQNEKPAGCTVKHRQGPFSISVSL